MRTSRDRDKISSLRSEGALRREREHKQRIGRIIPLLVFVAVGLLIAKQEFPVVDHWINRLISPKAWEAGEACRSAAQAAMPQSGFTRLLDSGHVEPTKAGYYVSDVQFAVLQSSGVEQNFRFSCNVTHAGEVVAIRRQAEGINNSAAESGTEVTRDTTPPGP
ncbi:MAG: hypothetical protein PVJ15_03570 [Gammaproteobacteria bacterium]|jgi:hypothetical protein